MKIRLFIQKLWYLAIYRFMRPRIIITKVALSGDGNIIDIRFWLSRPDKISPKELPYLVTEKNQKLELMYFTKFGIMKSKIRKHTNTGILLFFNRNNAVSAGESITLIWGELKSVTTIK